MRLPYNYTAASRLGRVAGRQCDTLEISPVWRLLFLSIASWCNGSTRDSGSLCLGSNPSEAAFKSQTRINQESVRHTTPEWPAPRRYAVNFCVSDSRRVQK